MRYYFPFLFPEYIQMKKMKYTSSIVAACFLLSAAPLCAQDIEKEFEEFARQQQQEFENFKNKADADFETFLRETWKKFDAFAPIPAPERPEPPQPVEFDKTKPTTPPVSIKPGALKKPDAPVPAIGGEKPADRPDLPAMENKPAPGVYVPGQPYTPVHIEMPTVKPALRVPRRAIEFYGTDFEVATAVLNGLTLAGNSEANVADAWKDLCGKDYEQLVRDCMTLKEEKNMSDMRMAKYETFIEDINSNIKKSAGLFGLMRRMLMLNNGSAGNTALALIYDYDKCNDYAKVIMDKSTLFLNSSDDLATDLWKRDYPTYEEFKEAKRTIEAAKKFVQLCRTTANSTEGYKFIFWALMILTVDKTDAEEHLALICDFAKMLRITEDEFEDIIQTVKIVYNEVATEYTFKSESIPSVLGSLFNMYGGQDIEEYVEY